MIHRKEVDFPARTVYKIAPENPSKQNPDPGAGARALTSPILECGPGGMKNW
jgi:hypothetical protein